MLAVLTLGPIVGAADDHIVQFDPKVDFAAVRTFAFRTTRIASDHAELNNALVISKITDAVRTALTSRGVKEAADAPDVIVDFLVAGQDYSVGPFGRASRIENARGRGGRRGGRGDPESSQPVGFTEGILVLDLVARESGLLIWRGVYRDAERDSGKFALKLPDDTKKLLAEFPPRRK